MKPTQITLGSQEVENRSGCTASVGAAAKRTGDSRGVTVRLLSLVSQLLWKDHEDELSRGSLTTKYPPSG